MNLMPLVFKALIIIALDVASEWLPIKFDNRYFPMAWIDGRHRYNDPPEIDTFFDRVISITYLNRNKGNSSREHQAIGVFITRQLLLTSFNAFRAISLSTDTLEHMEVIWMTHRYVDEMGRPVMYDYGRKKIKCARHVIPSPEPETWPENMRHGPHSPLHDLMVMCLEVNLVYPTPFPSVMYDFSTYKTWKREDENYIKTAGPIRTITAEPKDKLFRDELRFVSIGHLNDEHIKENRYLEFGEFGDIVDCDEWIPRHWGHFICLENTEKYPGLANGALLFCGTKLCGVGSLMLRKSAGTILVFTDVRPYVHLLNRTCTVADQEFRVPKDLLP